MKPISSMAVLLALLLGSVLAMACLSAWYVLSVRQFRQVQGELAVAEQNRARLRLLVADCLEYRKRNPAIEPLLRSANVLRLHETNRAGQEVWRP